LTLLCVPAGDRSGECQAAVAASQAQGRALIVLTKCDLPHAAEAVVANKPVTSAGAPAAIATSSRTGEGLDELRRAIAQELDGACGEAGATAAAPASSRPTGRSSAPALRHRAGWATSSWPRRFAWLWSNSASWPAPSIPTTFWIAFLGGFVLGSSLEDS
jgi:hypothetical protein